MPRPFRRLFSLDRRALIDLVRAQVALLRAQWRLRREPLGQLAIRDAIDPSLVSGDPARARAIALAVQRAASHGVFHPFCLVQTLALRDLLRADRIEGASIRIGVRRHEGVFHAHAWVVWGHMILGDRPEYVAQFTEVEDLRIMDRR